LISDARLRQDIEAGRPIWQARREHRARERAARFRQENAQKPTLNSSRPSRLAEVPPAEGGTVLDQAFAASARANLQEFKRVLKEEANEETRANKRKPDSDRRKKIKKERRREKKANTKDDAERDRNHAVAHGQPKPEASISPGLRGAVLASAVGAARGDTLENLVEDERGYTFDLASGILFDLFLVTVVLGLIWMCASTSLWLVRLALKEWSPPPERRAVSPARRVGGTRKKVRFNVPRKGRLALPTPETPFL
jgi:hypothetical protein